MAKFAARPTILLGFEAPAQWAQLPEEEATWEPIEKLTMCHDLVIKFIQKAQVVLGFLTYRYGTLLEAFGALR